MVVVVVMVAAVVVGGEGERVSKSGVGRCMNLWSAVNLEASETLIKAG